MNIIMNAAHSKLEVTSCASSISLFQIRPMSCHNLTSTFIAYDHMWSSFEEAVILESAKPFSRSRLIDRWVLLGNMMIDNIAILEKVSVIISNGSQSIFYWPQDIFLTSSFYSPRYFVLRWNNKQHLFDTSYEYRTFYLINFSQYLITSKSSFYLTRYIYSHCLSNNLAIF